MISGRASAPSRKPKGPAIGIGTLGMQRQLLYIWWRETNTFDRPFESKLEPPPQVRVLEHLVLETAHALSI